MPIPDQIQVSDALFAHTSPPLKSQWKECHGPHWRCRNAFLLLGVEVDEHKVSWLQGGVSESVLDWTQLSLLGDGGSTSCPRGRQYRDSVTSREPIWKETPVWGMDTPGPLSAPASSRHSCQSASPQTLRVLRLGEGLTPVVWGLSLAPGTDPSSSPHPPTPSP